MGVFGGSMLDTKLNTAPWFSVALSLVGGGLGLARMVMKANSLNSTATVGSSSIQNSGAAKKPAADNQNEVKKHRMPYDGFEDD
jgi:F0F1-type ATP synthase assembly protein I